MSISTSVLEELLQKVPGLRPQLYFKSSLTALSHAMEDQVLAGARPLLVIASFQQERFYRQEAHRYLRISELTPQVYVLAAPETSFTSCSDRYERIAFDLDDQLSHEWHLIVIGSDYSACLVCRERQAPFPESASGPLAMDQTRRFEGVWTFDRYVCCQAAEILLDRIQCYRPELADKTAEAKSQFLVNVPVTVQEATPDPFAQRLVTYLQAGQYKLLKAYRSIAEQERKERLVNSITSAIRRSLNPAEIFNVAAQELGQAMQACRCLIYRCKATDKTAMIQYEYRTNQQLSSLIGQTWPIQSNPLFQEVIKNQESVTITDTHAPTDFDLKSLKPAIKRWQIRSWLMTPVVHQGRLLGMVELHYCHTESHHWPEEELRLVEAIATQLGIALIQAEAYANLEDLNQQLEALERTRSNLIAITGHELRTPLSTIQVCLESLASEPDMPAELQQVMLSTALTDAERMRKLVQDFITLSRLESGRVEWHLEPLSFEECIDLALSSIRTRQVEGGLPSITADVPLELPLVQADGEWLVEVLRKLLENACKFTEPEGEVLIEAKQNGNSMLEVTIRDTGRGIEPNRLETVFDRFYQEEGALRRTAGGTGLGLAICRQIVRGLGGQIWAESGGRDLGSAFHFTVPIADETSTGSSEPPLTVHSRVPNRSRRTSRSRATLT